MDNVTIQHIACSRRTNANSGVMAQLQYERDKNTLRDFCEFVDDYLESTSYNEPPYVFFKENVIPKRLRDGIEREMQKRNGETPQIKWKDGYLKFIHIVKPNKKRRGGM